MVRYKAYYLYRLVSLKKVTPTQNEVGEINKEKVLRLEHMRQENITESKSSDITFKTNIWPYATPVDNCFLYIKKSDEDEFTKIEMTTLANDSNGFSITHNLVEEGGYNYYFEASNSEATGYKPQNAYADGNYTFNYSPGAVGVTENLIPEKFVVGKPYPNPFNPTAKLDFFVDKPANIIMKIFNNQGQVVSARKINVAKGINTVNISGTDLTSGVYFYQLKADGIAKVGKGRLLLIK